MKTTRREFCKMMAAGVVAAQLSLPRIMATDDTGSRVSKGENPKIAGYVHKYVTFTDLGSPCCVREKIKAGAFDKVLAPGALDIPCLKNRDPKIILGSTKDGTLRLSTDTVGLRFELDLPDTKEGRDTREDIRKGGTNGVDLAITSFMVAESDWRIGKDGMNERTITSFENIFNISLDVKEIRHNDFEGIIR